MSKYSFKKTFRLFLKSFNLAQVLTTIAFENYRRFCLVQSGLNFKTLGVSPIEYLI